MSTLAENLWRLVTVLLTVLLLCAASAGAFAHHDHLAHHQHHIAQAASIGEVRSEAAPAQPIGHNQHKRHGSHSHHHGGDCPMHFVCECNGLGCCGERYKGAISRTAVKDKPIAAIVSSCRIALIVFLHGVGIAELESRKRRGWLCDFGPPVHDWRNILYADSPRLRI